MSRRVLNIVLFLAIAAFFPLLFKKILPSKTDLAVTPASAIPSPAVEESAPPTIVASPIEAPPEQPKVVIKPSQISKQTQVGYAPRANLPFSATGSFPPLETTVPEPLIGATQFWARVYSQYGSDQVILHDQENLNTTYKVLDFRELMKDPNLSSAKKKAVREAQVSEAMRFLRQSLNSSAAENLRSQTGQRDRFAAGLETSGLYLSEIEQIFEGYGLPKDLTRLVFVESMFQMNAVSKVGAAGIWQFMPSSGRIFSLKVSPLI
ncbi:MAG: transglycosylase SLT domain-containing protein, partial [Deltaproteobacteria bacterium]|nr:transglycosylase SLT domain-containing protein [Deltaproteobacteria bacterium]